MRTPPPLPQPATNTTPAKTISKRHESPMARAVNVAGLGQTVWSGRRLETQSCAWRASPTAEDASTVRPARKAFRLRSGQDRHEGFSGSVPITDVKGGGVTHRLRRSRPSQRARPQALRTRDNHIHTIPNLASAQKNTNARSRRETTLSRLRSPFKSEQKRSIRELEVHDLVPRGDEVADELLPRVVAARRPRRAPGAASSSRRRGRRGGRPPHLAARAVAALVDVLASEADGFHSRAHVEQVDEEVVRQRARADR